MTKENRFEGLMGVVGKKKNFDSNSGVETSKNSNISASKHTDVQTSRKAKSANPDYTRTTVYLPKKMHKKLKAIALDEEREMSSIVEELIETWMSKR